jgi:hypothetical protein
MQMRKIILLFLALPLLGLAQNKNLISASQYFPKEGKARLFEKALAVHAKKWHKGDHKWRVSTIETGPDAGGYLVVEGPTNWEGIDKRGDLGDVHMKDWETTVQTLLSDRGSTMYLTFREDLSTVQLGDFSDKTSVTHVFFKPGYFSDVQANLLLLKKVWEADGATVAVYEASLSGEPQFVIATRYKQGLKERDVVNPTAFPARFNKANGEGSWAKYISMVKEGTARQWTEILYHKPEMDSK